MFITFEGPDGSGKTTQAHLLANTLRERGYTLLHTREPGGTSIGDQIRDVLHSLQNTEMHPHTEVLLYVASRAQLVAQVIRPALELGTIVLCDRYADSTLAYQGFGHGLELAGLRAIIAFATRGLKPDLTLYFDLSAEEGLRRRQRDADQGGEFNRLDAFALEFHQRVRSGYDTLIAEEPERWHRIYAEQPIEKVQAEVLQAVEQRIKS
jgi:dTMP kinase